MLSGPLIILTLKVLVSLVTVIYLTAIVALVKGALRWHGRLNTLFFVLTMTTVVAFEVLLRFGTDVSSSFSPEAREALRVHLMFSIPSTLLLPLMIVSGWIRWRRAHVPLGVLFSLCWLGTLITGLLLPSQ